MIKLEKMTKCLLFIASVNIYYSYIVSSDSATLHRSPSGKFYQKISMQQYYINTDQMIEVITRQDGSHGCLLENYLITDANEIHMALKLQLAKKLRAFTRH